MKDSNGKYIIQDEKSYQEAYDAVTEYLIQREKEEKLWYQFILFIKENRFKITFGVILYILLLIGMILFVELFCEIPPGFDEVLF